MVVYLLTNALGRCLGALGQSRGLVDLKSCLVGSLSLCSSAPPRLQYPTLSSTTPQFTLCPTTSVFHMISDIDSNALSAQSDSDFEVVLVTRAASNLALSDDSGSLVSAPSDLNESSDDEHIFISNIVRSSPNTPRPPPLTPSRLVSTPRPVFTPVARPIVEYGHDSDASDREDDSVASSYESDSDDDGSVRARPRALNVTSGRIGAPVSLRPIGGFATAHANGSAATIRPAMARSSPTRPLRRVIPAAMHAPAITTNTIVGIVASAPLSPPAPSDDSEIPYIPFTPAPTAVLVPVPITSLPAPQPAQSSARAPPIPDVDVISRKMWAKMNIARIELGLKPLKHAQREALNAKRASNKEKSKNTATAIPGPQASPRAKARPRPKPKPKAAKSETSNPLVAPRSAIGGSPVSSEDESSRARVSIFSPVNDMSVRSDSPDEDAYDEAMRQLDE